MDGVESMTRGWWRPTPGSIYPLLKEMTDGGIVRKLEDGRYELTQKGRSQAEGFLGPRHQSPRTTGDMLNRMQSFVSYMEDTKSSGKESLKDHQNTLNELAKRISNLAKDDTDGEDKD